MKSIFYLFLLAFSSAALSAQVSTGLINDFNTGDLGGWKEGGPSPNPPTVETTDGPSGAGDQFMRNISSGGNGAGSRWVVINQSADYQGDYTAAGIQMVQMDVRNSGDTEVTMRFAVNGNGGEFCSDSGVVISPGSEWQTINIPFDC